MDVRTLYVAGLTVLVNAAACGGHHANQPDSPAASRLVAGQAATIDDSVRAFAAAVAHSITREGPLAWRRYFLDSPAFFMASEGRLVLPNSDSATRVIRDLARTIVRIELRWDEGLRVDPLAPGLAVMAAPFHETRLDAAGRRVEETGYFTGVAEHHSGGWLFRDAHWSVPRAPSPVR
jgi:hypothetical protein